MTMRRGATCKSGRRYTLNKGQNDRKSSTIWNHREGNIYSLCLKPIEKHFDRSASFEQNIPLSRMAKIHRRRRSEMLIKLKYLFEIDGIKSAKWIKMRNRQGEQMTLHHSVTSAECACVAACCAAYAAMVHSLISRDRATRREERGDVTIAGGYSDGRL